MASSASKARAVGPDVVPLSHCALMRKLIVRVQRVPAMNAETDAILREPPVAGNELDTLLGALERQRR
jgi:hypothetical protein